MNKFQGTLNKPNYFGGKDERRYFMLVRICNLFQDNPLNAPIYKEGYWHYTFKVNTYTDRMRNAGRRVKSRYIVLFPWR